MIFMGFSVYLKTGKGKRAGPVYTPSREAENIPPVVKQNYR
jgi:hypothetical protein